MTVEIFVFILIYSLIGISLSIPFRVLYLKAKHGKIKGNVFIACLGGEPILTFYIWPFLLIGITFNFLFYILPELIAK